MVSIKYTILRDGSDTVEGIAVNAKYVFPLSVGALMIFSLSFCSISILTNSDRYFVPLMGCTSLFLFGNPRFLILCMVIAYKKSRVQLMNTLDLVIALCYDEAKVAVRTDMSFC